MGYFCHGFMKKIIFIAFIQLFALSTLMAGGELKLGQNYPNPANEKTSISVEFTANEALLTLSNILGEVITVQRLPHSGIFTLDLTEIPEGVYFYTLTADGHKVTKKLTVRK